MLYDILDFRIWVMIAWFVDGNFSGLYGFFRAPLKTSKAQDAVIAPQWFSLFEFDVIHWAYLRAGAASVAIVVWGEGERFPAVKSHFFG